MPTAQTSRFCRIQDKCFNTEQRKRFRNQRLRLLLRWPHYLPVSFVSCYSNALAACSQLFEKMQATMMVCSIMLALCRFAGLRPRRFPALVRAINWWPRRGVSPAGGRFSSFRGTSSRGSRPLGALVQTPPFPLARTQQYRADTTAHVTTRMRMKLC